MIRRIFKENKRYRALEKIPVDSYERIQLILCGMRGTIQIDIAKKDENESVISKYWVDSGKKNDEFRLEKRVTVKNEMILDLLNRHKIMCWDGFRGKHPKYAKDGIMFRFTAVVNDGKTIRADGSQNFPKNFTAFRDDLGAMIENNAQI